MHAQIGIQMTASGAGVARHPAWRWLALAALAICCAAALVIPQRLSEALPLPGAQPLAVMPLAPHATTTGDTSVPDAAQALRDNPQWDTEAPPSF
jgi:hypothetical protein